MGDKLCRWSATVDATSNDPTKTGLKDGGRARRAKQPALKLFPGQLRADLEMIPLPVGPQVRAPRSGDEGPITKVLKALTSP